MCHGILAYVQKEKGEDFTFSCVCRGAQETDDTVCFYGKELEASGTWVSRRRTL